MPESLNVLAFDIGAESGRAILGRLAERRLELSEIHRFPNGPVRLPDGFHWDALRMWTEIKQGLALALRSNQGRLDAVGLDTWGVDFALLDRNGGLLSNPYYYRDSRTDGMLQEAFKRMPRERIFALTGIQFMQINSLFQLLSMVVSRSPLLSVCETFLTIPDLFNYWLTGRKVSEFSIATTTQCYDPRQGRWSQALLRAMEIPEHIFPAIVPPGTIVGSLSPLVAAEIGAGDIPVIAPACHDTGSAVAGVPAESAQFVWISSGTWSIMGTELHEPVITAESLANNFTNEGGVANTFRFSKNIMGLWLVQECRRAWAAQGHEFSYGDLVQMAREAQPLRSIIDPDDSEFLKPGDMPARIRAFCQKTSQPLPESMGAVVRCALESVALKYRWTEERLEQMIGRRLEPIHIVGGGTQNTLLCQFTADATGRRVVTGPVEATAMGNIMAQAMALGYVGSLAEARQVVRNSVQLATYEPCGAPGWDEAYRRLLDIMQYVGEASRLRAQG